MRSKERKERKMRRKENGEADGKQKGVERKE